VCCPAKPVTKTAPVGGGFEERVECEKRKGMKYDPQTGRCIKIVGNVVKECEAKGPNYHYDPKTGSCTKTIGKYGAQEACEAKGFQYRL
jgi:hypothetical protein